MSLELPQDSPPCWPVSNEMLHAFPLVWSRPKSSFSPREWDFGLWQSTAT